MARRRLRARAAGGLTWLRVAGLYAALVAALYVPVTLGGRTLSPEHYQPHGVTARGAYGAPGRKPVYSFMVDLGTPAWYEAPINRYVGARWRRAEAPLWNPYQGLGAPLVAQYSSRALFPYQVLEDLAPATLADAFLLGRLWVAAMLTFGFLRRLVAGDASALLGGALYGLSGSLVWFINLEQMANVAMVLPGFFWACEVMVQERRPRGVVAAAAAAALLLLGGQPETALVALVAGALWTILRGVRLGEPARALSLGAVAAGLGAMLAAPLLLPFAEFYSRAFHIHAPGRIARLPPTPWSMGVQVFVPTWFERAAQPVRLPSVGHWDWVGGYVGCVASLVPLLVLARFRFRRRAEAAFLALLSLTILLKNLGVEPFVRLVSLPGFDMVFANRWAGPVWCFGLAAAAGLCADALAEPAANGTAAWTAPAPLLRALPWALVVAALAWVASMFRAALDREIYAGIDRSVFSVEFARDTYHLPSRGVASALAAAVALGAAWAVRRPRPGASLPLALLGLAVAELGFAIPRGYTPSWAVARVAAPALCVAAAWALYVGRRRPAVAAGALAVAVSLAVDRGAVRGLPDARDPYRAPPFVQYLQRHAGGARVMGVDGELVPNNASVFGLRDVRYLFALAPAESLEMTRDLLNWSQVPIDAALWFTGARTGWYPEPPGLPQLLARRRAYSLFGVRYVVAPSGSAAGRAGLPGGWRLVHQGDADVYENPSALPRARVVHAVERAGPGVAGVIGRLDDPRFDPERTALVDGDVRVSAPTRPSTATLVVDRDEQVVVDAVADAPGLLVLADAWYDTWEATVDGVAAPIVRTNGCMRGVALAAGAHRVEFRFGRRSYDDGLRLAALAAVVCAWLLRRPAA